MFNNFKQGTKLITLCNDTDLMTEIDKYEPSR